MKPLRQALLTSLNHYDLLTSLHLFCGLLAAPLDFCRPRHFILLNPSGGRNSPLLRHFFCLRNASELTISL